MTRGFTSDPLVLPATVEHLRPVIAVLLAQSLILSAIELN